MVFNFQRILSGFLIILSCIIFYLFKLDFFLISILGILIISELYKNKFLTKKNIIYLIFILPITFFIYYMFNFNIILLSIFFIISFLFSILFFYNYIYLNLIIIIFIYLSLLILIIERNLFYIILFVSFINDTVAYISGKIIEGPKIIAKISPNKTWSGTIISFLVSSFILFFVFNFNLIISLCLSSFYFFGDIYFSFIKRKNNIKDFSNLIPGHGGILDRVDSFIFTIIISYFLII